MQGSRVSLLPVVRNFYRIATFGLLLAMGGVSQLSAQDYIPATRAFDAPGCSDIDLGGIDIDFGLGTVTVPSPQRTNPEWKAIVLDSSKPPHLQPPTTLEGFVAPQPVDQTSKDQSTAEVAEEDLPWTHFTHDFTFKVIPDGPYQHLLSSWTRFPGLTIPDFGTDSLGICQLLGGTLDGTSCVIPPESCIVDGTGTRCLHTDMEVEWDNASLMDEKEGFQRIWGSVPEFAWPAVGDRVWVQGRWIFDCGHPSSSSRDFVKFSTELHPPHALVTYRLNHPALDSFPRPRVSAPNFPGHQSYLPVTGEPVILPPDAPNTGPTNIPLTEADIYVSGLGGEANDDCSLLGVPCPGNTGPFVPVNDRNYFFDIYPPGTDYLGIARPLVNGTFAVGRPVPDASLQWRIVDHSSELPTHACGGNDNKVCVTVDPLICPIDSSTPPPDQNAEPKCPDAPPNPTRVRVILPFAGTGANFFAKSILLGWDDVPTPAHNTHIMRTFNVRLQQFTVRENGMGVCCHDGDWRVFVNVGGQWRYMSPFFDTDAQAGMGIFGLDGGTNRCNGNALTENGDDDCFQFYNTPWTVSVEDDMPIHVAVGGFIARGVEDNDSSLFLCRVAAFFAGCPPPSSFGILDTPFVAFPFDNDDRIGTYEFDLLPPDYAPPTTQPAGFDCTVLAITGCSIRYEVQFRADEVPPGTAPASSPLIINSPSFTGGGGTFISSSTPLTLSTASEDAQGFQYRFHRQGSALPTYFTTAPPASLPVHWTSTGFTLSQPGLHNAAVSLSGAALADGPYDLQYSAQSLANLLEPRHTSRLILDNTPPVTTITQPAAIQYVHSAMLTLSYTASDGSGSGVQSFLPKMDGATTLPNGVGLANGQMISLLTALSLGTHTFSVDSVDNVNNAGTNSVTFSIIVTPDSIKEDVQQFLQGGAIKNKGQANSLLAKLDAAAAARSRGQCATAANIYQAFINELEAQSGKGVSASAAAIMIADAQYLIAHCP